MHRRVHLGDHIPASFDLPRYRDATFSEGISPIHPPELVKDSGIPPELQYREWNPPQLSKPDKSPPGWFSRRFSLMWQWAPHVSLRAPHVSRPLSPSSLPLSPPPSSAVAPLAPPCRPSRPPPLPTAAACLPSARSAPATAGVGGGGWQAAAAWSRVRPWRLLLEGTANEVVAGDKA